MIAQASGWRLRNPAGHLLQELTFRLDVGQSLVLKGANGSGKSTLLRAVFAQLEQGVKQDKLELREGLSYAFMPQSLNREFLLPLTLGDVAALSDADFSGDEPWLDLLPAALWSRRWNEASGGEKQRALLMQTLSQRCDLYLLDEPFNHLDAEAIATASQIIKYLMEDGGRSVVMATHVMPADLPLAKLKVLSLDAGTET